MRNGEGEIGVIRDSIRWLSVVEAGAKQLAIENEQTTTRGRECEKIRFDKDKK